MDDRNPGDAFDAENIARRHDEVATRVRDACRRTGRDEDSVRIITVTKGQPLIKVSRALSAGLRVFGESRPQEFREKHSFLEDVSGIQWHFIGPLQANKVRHVVGLCSLLHSVDNLDLARAVDHRAGALGIQADALLQVNASGEASKQGVAPGEVLDTVREISRLEGIRLLGLMTMAPYGDPGAARSVFRTVACLAEEVAEAGIEGVSMDELSMGMTDDYQVAVEEGATLVRVGRAILGPRRD